MFKGGSLNKMFADPVAGLAAVADAIESPGDGHYRTAFFEAFPENPGCFLRGEGKTIEEAEESCWMQYQRVAACEQHDFDRRDRRDGYGFCRKCGMGAMFAAPLDLCTVCSSPTYFAHDADGKPYCEAHVEFCPEDKRTGTWRLLAELKRSSAADVVVKG